MTREALSQKPLVQCSKALERAALELAKTFDPKSFMP